MGGTLLHNLCFALRSLALFCFVFFQPLAVLCSCVALLCFALLGFALCCAWLGFVLFCMVLLALLCFSWFGLALPFLAALCFVLLCFDLLRLALLCGFSALV